MIALQNMLNSVKVYKNKKLLADKRCLYSRDQW